MYRYGTYEGYRASDYAIPITFEQACETLRAATFTSTIIMDALPPALEGYVPIRIGWSQAFKRYQHEIAKEYWAAPSHQAKLAWEKKGGLCDSYGRVQPIVDPRDEVLVLKQEIITTEKPKEEDPVEEAFDFGDIEDFDVKVQGQQEIEDQVLVKESWFQESERELVDLSAQPVEQETSVNRGVSVKLLESIDFGGPLDAVAIYTASTIEDPTISRVFPTQNPSPLTKNMVVKPCRCRPYWVAIVRARSQIPARVASIHRDGSRPRSVVLKPNIYDVLWRVRDVLKVLRSLGIRSVIVGKRLNQMVSYSLAREGYCVMMPSQHTGIAPVYAQSEVKGQPGVHFVHDPWTVDPEVLTVESTMVGNLLTMSRFDHSKISSRDRQVEHVALMDRRVKMTWKYLRDDVIGPNYIVLSSANAVNGVVISILDPRQRLPSEGRGKLCSRFYSENRRLLAHSHDWHRITVRRDEKRLPAASLRRLQDARRELRAFAPDFVDSDSDDLLPERLDKRGSPPPTSWRSWLGVDDPPDKD